MLAAVERHVLDEVGQAELVVVLDDGPDVHDQPQLRAPHRPLVGPDVVPQPVRQVADRDARIDRDRLIERHRQRRIRDGLFLRAGQAEPGKHDRHEENDPSPVPNSHEWPFMLCSILLSPGAFRTGRGTGAATLMDRASSGSAGDASQ